MNLMHPVAPESPQPNTAFTSDATLLQTLMDRAPFACAIQDERGRFLFYNRLFAQRMAIGAGEWLGKPASAVLTSDSARIFQQQVTTLLATDSPVTVQQHLTTQAGVQVRWTVCRFALADATGRRLIATLATEPPAPDPPAPDQRAQEFLRIQQQLTQSNQRLRELAATDELTGLRNRRSFEERLLSEFSFAQRKSRPLALLMLDVDHFKQVNDRHGHPAGDETLTLVARVLQHNMRLPDLAARHGGDEFAILLPDSNAAAALSVAARLTEALRTVTWPVVPATVSMGIAELTPAVLTPFDLVNHADHALYQAKAQGRARAIVFEEEPPA